MKTFVVTTTLISEQFVRANNEHEAQVSVLSELCKGKEGLNRKGVFKWKSTVARLATEKELRKLSQLLNPDGPIEFSD